MKTFSVTADTRIPIPGPFFFSPCIDSIIPTPIFCQAGGGSRLLRTVYAHLPDTPVSP